MALHELAAERVRVTLVAAEEEFVERPMTVAEPFAFGTARRIALRRIAADFGADFVLAEAVGVSSDAARVVVAGGESMRADTVIVAVGARPVAAFADAITFGLAGSGRAMRELLADLARGAVRRVAFVAPSLAGWALPLYELALMTARTVAAAGADDVRLSLVTPEARPLAVFGGTRARPRSGCSRRRESSSSVPPTRTFGPGRFPCAATAARSRSTGWSPCRSAWSGPAGRAEHAFGVRPRGPSRPGAGPQGPLRRRRRR